MRAVSLFCGALVVVGCSGSPNNFGDDSNGDSGSGPDGSMNNGDGGPGTDTGTQPPSGGLAQNISVTGVTVLQGVEVQVVTNGKAASPNAPIVAGRQGLVRAFATLGSGFSGDKITALLTLHTGGMDHLFTAALTPKVSSTDADFTSTFNFTVDAGSFGTDTTFLVQLFDDASMDNSNTAAQYPTSGTATSLGVTQTGGVTINVYPINFTNGEGSSPAVDALDISAYQAAVMGYYPATSITVSVQPTLNYAGSVPQATGSGWTQLLNTMLQKRAGDPTVDVYYYGAFAPTADFDSYCGGGCIAGLSSIPSSPSNVTQKASIGLVYGGTAEYQQATGQTMGHEVGHGHGRSHADTTSAVMGCTTPSGIDPSFPYADGSIGVWGWDINASTSHNPSNTYDLMGYCANVWVSDYTYSALASWVATDNGADMALPQTPTQYRQIMVAGDGTLTVGNAFPVYGVVSGTKRSVSYVVNGATRTVDGYYFPYDHLPGGYILAPEVAPSFTAVQVAGYPKAALR
jgi:hypothetical protein